MPTIILLLMIVFMPSLCGAVVLTEDAEWRGTVEIQEDVLVPAGVSLTIAAGTEVWIRRSESTKIDPEYFSHRTEITIRGQLRIAGTGTEPVRLLPESGEGEESWAGVIVDRGRASISGCRISGAETGIYVLDGELSLDKSVLSANRYGVLVQGGKARVRLVDSRLARNEYGLARFGGSIERLGVVFEGNRKQEVLSVSSPWPPPAPAEYRVPAASLTRSYGNVVLTGETVWRGRILIDGVLRLPPEARLIVLPGTVVEFTRRDTNGDGIGENGLMLQGMFLAKGTPEEPIIFRSAAGGSGPGDWDAINILGSDAAQNLLEYCLIRDAYRGLHFHFANVAVNRAMLHGNYRGMQFQESTVTINDSVFYGNRSAVQARDSEVVFRGNRVSGNDNGANFFRLDLRATDNVFTDNARDGLRIREGAVTVENNLLAGNRFGLLVADAVYGRFNRNVISSNLETGVLLRNCDHVELAGNMIQINAVNGISIRDSRGSITGNSINGNRERGMGIISFAGVISGNNFDGNGLYAVGLEGDSDVEAPDNWWSDADLEQVLYDRRDEARLGEIHFQPMREDPVEVIWPLPEVNRRTVWAGAVSVPSTVRVAAGAGLEIRPGTRVAFAENAGLEVRGRLRAGGEAARRIVFTSAGEQRPGFWGEIRLQQALPGRFAFCDFEYADWAVHNHFTNLEIEECRFSNNNGGIRFRSGPLVVRRSLFMNNRIGLRSFRGIAELRENTITANEIGIFVREKGGGLTIEGNNIFGNTWYNLRLGDFNREDVAARRNWWGGKDPVDTFFDGRRESYIGLVHYTPVLAEPVAAAPEAHGAKGGNDDAR